LHRDIKPDNIAFEEENNLESLKIIDFGLSVFLSDFPFQILRCGTPGFIAPEIFTS